MIIIFAIIITFDNSINININNNNYDNYNALLDDNNILLLL